VDLFRTRSRAALVALVATLTALAGHASSGALDARLDSSSVLRTARVNVSTAGAQSNGSTFGAVVSGNGRYVAFTSAASTLVPRDRNRTTDVFVYDLKRGVTARVSVSSRGVESNGPSLKPSLSADGRVVAFPSWATNLVRGDRNGTEDIFVRIRPTATTKRVSTTARGEANGPSRASLVSADGRVVVFSSEASNLVPEDRNAALDVFRTEIASRRVTRVSARSRGEPGGRSEASSVNADGRVVGFRSYAPNLVPGDRNELADVFVVDGRTGATQRVNVSSTGAQANAPTFRGMVSGNGGYVGFRSRASNLVPGDTNEALDVFVHDRATGRTRRVSVASDGTQADASRFDRSSRANSFASRPFLSADGRYAAFSSRAPNLVPGDRNGKTDVFVHDLRTGRTIIVSVAHDRGPANGDSFVNGISADGRVVAFSSLADNLVPGDTNARKDVFVTFLSWGRAARPVDASGPARRGPRLSGT
jgi:Tol biopolymer transport system component